MVYEQGFTPFDYGMIVGAKKMRHSIFKVATALFFSQAIVYWENSRHPQVMQKWDC